VGEGGKEGLRGVWCGEGKRNECGVVVVLRLGGVVWFGEGQEREARTRDEIDGMR
jgi:hypothetical protein